MKTEDLIVELARTAGPVRRLPSPAVRAWIWMAVTVPLVLGAASFLGWRGDLAAVVTQYSFAVLVATATASAVLAAMAAFALSVPGAERSRIVRWLPLLAVAAWLVANGVAFVTASADASAADNAVHGACVLRVAALAAVPAALIVLMVGRAAPLEPFWTSALAALAAASVALAVVQLICPFDGPAHALVSHFVPALGFVVAASIAGRRAMTTWRRAGTRRAGRRD